MNLNGVETYGQLQSEKLTEESRVARQIVKEIGDFGINDRQRWLVIYNLAMELENVEDMKELTTFIRDRRGDQLFVTSIFGGGDDGSP